MSPDSDRVTAFRLTWQYKHMHAEPQHRDYPTAAEAQAELALLIQNASSMGLHALIHPHVSILTGPCYPRVESVSTLHVFSFSSTIRVTDYSNGFPGTEIYTMRVATAGERSGRVSPSDHYAIMDKMHKEVCGLLRAPGHEVTEEYG